MKYRTPREAVVAALRRLYLESMTSTSGGNLSVRDTDGTVYITPSAIDKGALTEDDIVAIKPDGVFEGRHVPSIEHRFHLAIYGARPDVGAIIHAHSPTLVAYAAAGMLPDTSILPQTLAICGKPALIGYASPGSAELSDKVARAFSDGAFCAVMENHGAVAVAGSMEEAFVRYEMFDRAAEIESGARTLGGEVRSLSEKHLIMHRLKSTPPAVEYAPPPESKTETECRRILAEFVKRAYKNRLMTASEGTFSMRVTGEDAFIITPHGVDRSEITPADFVRIENDRAERGKVPSRSFPLHTVLYAKNPDWNAVVVAEPPHSMAYAVSDAEYGADVMSESAMILRGAPKFPFGSTFMQPAMLAAELDEEHPVAVIENDCVIAGGKTALSAFDRLEVFDYGARSLITAAAAKLQVKRIK